MNTPKQPYMSQILTGAKTHEFRRYPLPDGMLRVWFYISSPTSALQYICEVTALPKRGSIGWTPLPPSANGENQRYNERDASMEGFDWAYEIGNVYELREVIGIRKLHTAFGFSNAPRWWMYVPVSLSSAVVWNEQRLVREGYAELFGAIVRTT